MRHVAVKGLDSLMSTSQITELKLNTNWMMTHS